MNRRLIDLILFAVLAVLVAGITYLEASRLPDIVPETVLPVDSGELGPLNQ